MSVTGSYWGFVTPGNIVRLGHLTLWTWVLSQEAAYKDPIDTSKAVLSIFQNPVEIPHYTKCIIFSPWDTSEQCLSPMLVLTVSFYKFSACHQFTGTNVCLAQLFWPLNTKIRMHVFCWVYECSPVLRDRAVTVRMHLQDSRQGKKSLENHHDCHGRLQ